MMIIFKMILSFIGFTLTVYALDKVSRASKEEGWNIVLNNVTITLIGLAYVFFIAILQK